MKQLRQYWDRLAEKMDAMSLRERALVFAATAFLLISLVNSLALDPLLAEQKRLSQRVVQQQEKMKELQAQLAALLQAKREDANSPLRQRVAQLRQQLAEGDAYLQDRRDKLVPPEKMAGVLEQMLNRNSRLQLVALQTLPAMPLVDSASGKEEKGAVAAQSASMERQVYKHGVEITVRGNYADLLQYLSSLEKLPTRMYWGKARMSVVQHPTIELTLTLYTLNLDKTWIQV